MAATPTSKPETRLGEPSASAARAAVGSEGAAAHLFDAETFLPFHEEPLVDGVSVALDDEARKRRAKALSCIAPIVLLEENKGRRGLEEYDLQELALAAIELIVDAMTFEGGATSTEVLEALTPLTAAQQWGRPDDEHRRVAEAVVETLTAPHSGAYGDYRGEDYVRRRYDVQLIREEEGAEGIHLRATDEAINAIVGALDVDVESAQHAAEEMLRNLVSRGRLDAAVQVANDARRRSIQYAEKIRQLLSLTQRNVGAVDWAEAAPRLVREALDHLGERLQLERLISRNLEERRAEAGDDASATDRARVAKLIVLLEDCTRRHTFLQGRVMEAHETFLREQERQSFMPFASLRLFDPDEELLRPVLAASLGDIADSVSRYFTGSAGLAPVRLVRLAHLLPMLLREPAERDELGEEIGEVEFVEDEAPEEVFDPATWTAVEELLSRIRESRRLTELLADARHISEEAADLLRLRVLHAFAPELDEPRELSSAPILFAHNDGAHLDDRVFAGADLLVSWIRVDAKKQDAAEPISESARAMESVLEESA